MSLKSAKAKGRRGAFETRDLLVKYAPHLVDDIMVPTGSVGGADLVLSPRALETYPFAFECKNVEKLNIWEGLAQAQSHTDVPAIAPLLVFKRNRSQQYVALPFETFLKILQTHLEVRPVE